jgi:short-subunit dehydrogenase
MDRSAFLHRYGPWAVVTGASDGIGRAFALELAEKKLSLVLVARREDRLHTIAGELAAAGAPETRVLPLDLADASSLPVLDQASQSLDIGLLIAAAGFGTSGAFLQSPLASELDMIDVNCRAVAALSHTFGQRFATRGRGGLVLMSSLLAFQGVAGAANYAATKAFVQTLAEGLKIECRPRGVDVLAVAPGPVRTGFEARAGMRMSFGEHPRTIARGTLAALGRASTVRPGWISKGLETSLAALPRRGRAAIMSQVMSGMIRHHGERPA